MPQSNSMFSFQDFSNSPIDFVFSFSLSLTIPSKTFYFWDYLWRLSFNKVDYFYVSYFFEKKSTKIKRSSRGRGKQTLLRQDKNISLHVLYKILVTKFELLFHWIWQEILITAHSAALYGVTLYIPSVLTSI